MTDRQTLRAALRRNAILTLLGTTLTTALFAYARANLDQATQPGGYTILVQFVVEWAGAIPGITAIFAGLTLGSYISLRKLDS